MRILLVGATGTLGRAVASALGERHEVLAASRHGAYPVDITDADSIASLYANAGAIDAVACAAGSTPFAPLAQLTRNHFLAGVNGKLLSQVELVRQGMAHVADGGSFTLISGILAHDAIRTGTVAGLVNGGVEAFVHSAAIGLPRGQRINAVSPTVLEESWSTHGPSFPGYRPVPAADAAAAYVKSVEGAQTGQVFRVGF